MSKSTFQYFNNRNFPKTTEALKDTLVKDAEKICNNFNTSFDELWTTTENIFANMQKSEGKDYFYRTHLDRMVDNISHQIWNLVFENENGYKGNEKKAGQTADNAVSQFLKKFK